MAGPRAQDTRALQLGLNAMLGPFVASSVNGTRIGAAYEFVDQTVNTTDTTFALYNFGRKPSRVILTGQHQAGSIFNGSNQRSDWTAEQIVLRASVSGTYSFWVV